MRLRNLHLHFSPLFLVCAAMGSRACCRLWVCLCFSRVYCCGERAVLQPRMQLWLAELP